jgi:CubicO group peptidase (beta-lactamase class C family)
MYEAVLGNGPGPTIARKADVPHDHWDRAPWNRWSFQHVRELVPTVQVWRGDGPAMPLPAAYQEVDEVVFTLDGEKQTLGAFLQSSYTDGFLVLHRGQVINERYFNGMTAHTPHLSQSVAKSIVGTVAGILIGRGQINPAAPLTKYLPELSATAYRGATVQHVLDMTSGVVFDETYTATASHMAWLDAACGWKRRRNDAWPGSVRELTLRLTETECPHGASFRYRSIETDVLAFVLERASGAPLAELVGRELWQPLGAEQDAYFTVDAEGYALADGGFNATLRDYARFALLHLGQGAIGPRQVVPAAWIEEIVAGARHDLFEGDYRNVLPQGAYHNQFWVEGGGSRAYMARGVFGQFIYIDPEADFAAVKLSSWPDFIRADRSRAALAAVKALRDAFSAIG